MNANLIKGILCLVGAVIGIYVAWWLASSDDRRKL